MIWTTTEESTEPELAPGGAVDGPVPPACRQGRQTGRSYNLRRFLARLTWDAWNRLVKVKNTGSSVVATYEYDGAQQRFAVRELHGSVQRS